ncbi:thioredoxin domain-containing protein [Saccharibacillus sp. CPCC 101409]|uniref:DsbA family protein n=1 Tax=Saccharibacillus sp. CPCC 101409 TaxID=3058041 RepID=UPI002672EC36|nr:thioredoxin domain-containing protein [Saccharibacillus sp. CPCC 101409]MDO3410775.1 thioredoxin domain-containing protein [Saccharibacillus sp. CPCC 101409]
MNKNKKPAPKSGKPQNNRPQAGKPQTAKKNTGGAPRPQAGSAASQWTSGSKRKKSNLGVIALGFVGIIVVLAVLIYVLTKAGENQTAKETSEPVILTNYDASKQPTLGNADSDVKIVEFGDFKCPDCKVWSETVLPELKTKYLDNNEASFQFADYPFLADDSDLLALGGQAVYEQNPEDFWKYYEAVYANQDTNKVRDAWITEDYIVDLVKKSVPDIDIDTFTSDLKDKKYQAEVDADVKAGDDSKITGTPTIFVNGTKVDNPTAANVEAAVEAAKAE